MAVGKWVFAREGSVRILATSPNWPSALATVNENDREVLAILSWPTCLTMLFRRDMCCLRADVREERIVREM